MEIGIHTFNLTFTNNAAAELAKMIAADTFKAMMTTDYNYNPYELFAKSLSVKGEVLTSEEACLTAEDFMNAAAAVIKAIAENLKTENFTFNTFGEDTYTESCVDGCFKDGLLTITSTYYPNGDCEYLGCPECGEFVVSLEEYDPSKTYVCPECGEELDLSEMYAEVAPVITREIIEVK